MMPILFFFFPPQLQDNLNLLLTEEEMGALADSFQQSKITPGKSPVEVLPSLHQGQGQAQTSSQFPKERGSGKGTNLGQHQHSLQWGSRQSPGLLTDPTPAHFHPQTTPPFWVLVSLQPSSSCWVLEGCVGHTQGQHNSPLSVPARARWGRQ